jgi:hypothetical protein
MGAPAMIKAEIKSIATQNIGLKSVEYPTDVGDSIKAFSLQQNRFS